MNGPFTRCRAGYVIERPVSAEEITAMAIALARRKLRRGRALTAPRQSAAYLTLKLAPLEHEVFCVLFLDNRHRVLAFEELFRGTVDGAAVYPREVVKRALGHNAAAVILAHNHPSGVAEPSQSDRQITARLQQALAIIDVRVLDHFIIGETAVSFAERGWL